MTYATLLRDAGYRTGYFGKWHMGTQTARPGFDRYASFVGQGEYQDCPFLVDGEVTPTDGWVDDVSTDYCLDFIGRTGHGHGGDPGRRGSGRRAGGRRCGSRRPPLAGGAGVQDAARPADG